MKTTEGERLASEVGEGRKAGAAETRPGAAEIVRTSDITKKHVWGRNHAMRAKSDFHKLGEVRKRRRKQITDCLFLVIL
jgi:hypothetical protein